MRQTAVKPMSVETYIQHELRSERRSEYINGQLFEIPGEKRTNNRLAGEMYLLLVEQLRGKGYAVYSHDMKVAIPGCDKYYYPDVFATGEPETEANMYIMYAPGIIVEVVSATSHKHDYIDKYIDYTTIPSLQYYLIAEPETPLVNVFEREGDDWISHKYTSLDDTIRLPKLGAALPMGENIFRINRAVKTSMIMRQTVAAAMTEEAYIQYELKGECRHEYVNGQLFEMPGEQDINSQIALHIYVLLHHLETMGYFIYAHDIKVAIPGGRKYRYPDLFVTAEPQQTDPNRYIKRAPLLIVEVISEDSHKTDYIDKLIEYTRIPTLQYYLIIEPETVQVTVCERDGEDWVSHKYTRADDIIQLPKLEASLPLSTIYKHLRS